MRLLTSSLIVYKNTILDYVPLLSFYAVVVIAAGIESARLRFIAYKIHNRRSKLQLAQFIHRDEARAGIICLMTKSSIQFRGVTYRFVYGEPEIGWSKNQIFLAGCHRSALMLGYGIFSRLARVIEKRRIGDIFVTHSHRL